MMDMNITPIKILQWNSRSIYSNLPDIKHKIATDNLDIIIISETWLKPEDKIKFTGYNLIRKDRNDGRGGVAIIIKNSIPHKSILVDHHIQKLEVTGVETMINNKKTSILSVYCPPGHRIKHEEWDALVSPMLRSTHVILAGDVNCHHRQWGCTMEDLQGKEFLKCIHENNLVLLNNGDNTMQPSPYRQMQPVDVTVVSPQLALDITWEVGRDAMGSDHFPIIINITRYGTSIQNRPIQSKINIKKIKWEQYKEEITTKLTNYNPIYDTIQRYEQFEKIIIESALKASGVDKDRVIDQTLRETNNSRRRKNKITPWWNEECSRAVARRRLATKQFKLLMNNENYNILKQVEADTRKTLRNQKRLGWKEYCTKINRETPIKEIWQMIRKFKSSQPTPRQMEDDLGWLEDFHSQIAPSTTTLNLKEITQINTPLQQHNMLNENITRDELEVSLNELKNTAPGVDGIVNLMLVNLPNEAKEELLQLYNNMYKEYISPDTWKTQIIIPILKPRKNPNNPTSYRPIALLSTLGKLMDKILLKRLDWWLEEKEIIDKNQFGFRKGKSCIDSINILHTDIKIAWNNKKTLIAVLLDISAAFDNVQIHIMIEKLKRIDIPEHLIRWIAERLIQRKIIIKSQRTLSEPRIANMGLPQGSVWSPTLFSIYTNDITLNNSPNITALKFADDIIIYGSDSTIQNIITSLNSTLSILNKNLEELGLSLSPQKSKVIIFTRKRNIMSVQIKIYQW